jgi:COMPASS component SWD3
MLVSLPCLILVRSPGSVVHSRLWTPLDGQCHRTISPDPTGALVGGHLLVPQHVQFSPNAKYLLATFHPSLIRLYDITRGDIKPIKSYTGHVNTSYCVSACFSTTDRGGKGGKYIVSGSEDGRIWIWDLQSCQGVQVVEGAHQDVVVAVGTHPRLNMIATGSIDGDKTIKIWVDEPPGWGEGKEEDVEIV